MRNTPSVSPELAPVTFLLRRFVEDVRAVAPGPGDTLPVARLPDGRTTLILRLFDTGSGDVCLAGPRTRAQFKHATGIARAVQIRFRPGWSASLFGVSASAVTDRTVPLEDIWGATGRASTAELLAARSLPELLEALSRAIAPRMHEVTESSSARLARRAVRLLEAGEVRVESVAQRLGITARHLRRVFSEGIGIGPKEFARTVRLQRAVRSAATSRDWGRIASDAGYYDQAHLIADFRDLVGFTPAAFVRHARSTPSRA